MYIENKYIHNACCAALLQYVKNNFISEMLPVSDVAVNSIEKNLLTMNA